MFRVFNGRRSRPCLRLLSHLSALIRAISRAGEGEGRSDTRLGANMIYIQPRERCTWLRIFTPAGSRGEGGGGGGGFKSSSGEAIPLGKRDAVYPMYVISCSSVYIESVIMGFAYLPCDISVFRREAACKSFLLRCMEQDPWFFLETTFERD